MKIYPQDLGVKRHVVLLWRRAGKSAPAGDPPAPRVGRLGRLWVRDTGLDPDTTAATLCALRRPLFLLRVLSLVPVPFVPVAFEALRDGPAPLLFLAAAVAWVVLCTVFWPRTLFQLRHRTLARKPVTAGEIAALLPGAQDELERTYLTLVMDIVQRDPAVGAELDLRSALRALGDAIDRLPATRVVSDSPDILTEVLRRTATDALAAAQAEPDRVVAASLVRRAEALQRRADATHRSALLVRRFTALRQEMAAETEALRAGLTAFYTGANDIADLTGLAEDIRRVAAEAAAITAARDEVDAFVASTPYTPSLAPEPRQAKARLNLGHE